MNSFPQILKIGIASLLFLGVTSCASAQLQVESQPPEAEASPSENLTGKTAANTPQKPTPNPPVLKEPTAPADTLPITIYRVDSECSNLVPEAVIVPVENAVEATVAKTLELQRGFELPLSYRVEIDPHYQIAVIDLRVSTTSRRGFYSLSACEQMTLFETLRRSLTDNSNLQIREVFFTNLGEELIL